MRSLSRAFLALILVLAMATPFAASAQMMPKPDDSVTFDLAAEDWVTAKTARLVVNVDAAVAGGAAATMRADMTRAVNDLAKTDWKLTAFNRGEDQTGLERWNTLFEGRVPEQALNGLHDIAKKLSKAGMRLTITDMDFSPTLEERQAAIAALRVQIYKNAQKQLADLNAAIPGRAYRIAAIDFNGTGGFPTPVPMVRSMAGKMMAMDDMASVSMTSMDSARAVGASPESAPGMERAEKVTLSARITLAAVSDAPAH